MRYNRLASKCLLVVLCLVLLTGCAIGSRTEKEYKEGLKLLEEEKWEQAAEKFENAAGEVTAAEQNSAKENPRKSEQILNKKISYGLGAAYYHMQDYEKANVYLEKARSIPYLERWDSEIMRYQIDVLCALGNYEQASERIQMLREDEPEDFPLLFKEYFILEALGNDEAKEALLKEGLKIKGSGSEFLLSQAKLQYFLGNAKEAREGLEEAAKKGENEALLYLGRIYEDKSEYKKAISYYEDYRSAGEQQDFANIHIALCYEKSGDKEEALSVYESAIENSDGSYLKELRCNQIIALEKDAQYEEALEKCRDYVKEYPDDDTMKKEYEFLKTRV